MGEALLFALIASSALPLGGWIGAWHPPPKALTAALLAFASGALITAVAFELFEDAFEHGGAWRAGVAFLAGATVFIVVDTWLDNYTERRHAAGAVLASLADTLMPEAYKEGGPRVAYFTALGFLLSFLVSAA